MGSRIFFSQPGPDGPALWVTDGTREGTARLVSRSSIPNPSHFTPAGQRLYFLSGGEVWTSDGTPDGTLPVFSFELFAALTFAGSLQTAGETVYFAVHDDAVGDARSRRIRSTSPPPWRSSPGGAVVLAAFVAYDDGEFEKELWVTDGTVAGTRPVSAPRPAPSVSSSSTSPASQHRSW